MQPLSKVHRNALVSFGQDDTMTLRPKLAVKVAEFIAEWANIETMLGIFLGFLLHTKAKTAMAMFLALENRAAQLRMIESATKSELPPDRVDVFTALMEQCLRPTMRLRDRFAHWCWGHSPDLPKALLLLSPDDNVTLHFAALHVGGHADVDDDKVFVITDRFLENALRDLRKTQSYLAMLVQSLDLPDSLPRLPQAFERLSNKPEIQRGLALLQKRREKPQAIRQGLPGTGDPSQS